MKATCLLVISTHYEGLPLCDNKPVRFFVCCGWGGEHGGYNERLDSSQFVSGGCVSVAA
jgi:hypothetical protein